MARNGTSYSINITAGAGQATTLQTGLAANLTYWTVSSLFTFGNRSYIVLTQNTYEILIVCPNAGTETINSSVYVDYRGGDGESTSTNYPIALSFAPDGGFTTSFGAANDPATLAFWDHIVTTQGKRPPTKTYRIFNYQAGEPQYIIHWIEDDAIEFLEVVGYRSAGLNTSFCSSCIIAPDMFDVTLQIASPPATNNRRFKPEGLIYIKGESTISGTNKTTRNGMYFSYWRDADNSNQSVLDAISDAPLKNVPKSPNSDGTTQTRECVAFDGFYQAYINPNYLRFISHNLNTYKVKFGADTNYNFIEITRDFATPWDFSLANPV